MKSSLVHRFRCLFILTGCFLVLSTTLPAQSNLNTELEAFLAENVPYLKGTIEYQESGSYFASVETNIDRAQVKIIRKDIEKTDNGKRLVERTLGTGSISMEGANLGKIKVSDTLKNRVELGDRVRLKEQSIAVRNNSELADRQIRMILKDHPGITDVEFLNQNEGTSFPLLLSLSSSKLQLWNTNKNKILGEKKIGPSPTRQERTEPETNNLQEIVKFNRPITDFEWAKLPTERDIHILVLGAKNSIGFARHKDDMKGAHWKTINGSIMDISIAGLSTNNPGNLFLLVVRKKDDVIHTGAYTFDVRNGTLDRHWNYKDVWIRRSNDRFFAQEIGMNTPFSPRLHTVTVDRDGWDWKESDYRSLSTKLLPPSYVDNGTLFSYLQPDGSLRVLQGQDNKLRSPLTFGGSSHSVKATRAEMSRSLHPEFSTKKLSDDKLEIFIPRNIPSGIPYLAGMTSYNQSRLFLLETENNRSETRWESKRLSGYVVGTERAMDSYWSILVNPETDRSQLQRLDVSGS